MPGGRYRVLDDTDIDKIHEAVLEVLETVGFAGAIPSCVDVCVAVGAIFENGRLKFPRSLVEDTIAQAGRHFVVHGRDPKHDLEPWGRNIYYGTGGAAVYMVDAVTGEYRDSTLLDLYHIARVAHEMENISFFQRPVVARDMEESRDLDFNTCYACVSGTTKHIGSSWVDPTHVDESLKMLHAIAGSEKQWRERPFVSMTNCFVVPPLNFAEDACRCLEAAVSGGMPVLLLAAGQAGATSPVPLAGTIVQEVAEVIGALVYVNAIVPGHPAIAGPWPFVSDLRTGAMSGGSGEQSLLMSACAQMAHFYDLTGGVCSGMSDSKMPDQQAGMERGYSHALVGNTGANMIYESAGMMASLLGFSLESLVIDNDSLGAAIRTVRGIEVNDDTIALNVIQDVCENGPGHYLSHEQTLSLMQTEFEYPNLSNRQSPKEWAEVGSPILVEEARKVVSGILNSEPGTLLDGTLDDKIRADFGVRFPREAMLPVQFDT
ncbi:MAG: Glycine betaine methyltransferase [Gammaproteobacteria bacterium]|nr:Glycine betaine methyltransferase [Gammaproteobacteria bacterium]